MGIGLWGMGSRPRRRDVSCSDWSILGFLVLALRSSLSNTLSWSYKTTRPSDTARVMMLFSSQFRTVCVEMFRSDASSRCVKNVAIVINLGII